jgi:hypothetical protein
MLWAVTHSRKILQFNILQTIQTYITGISDNPDVLESMQIVEKMERETGIEPATNSLEECVSIANKRLQRSWRAILTHDTH